MDTLSGVWKSSYEYDDSKRGQSFRSEHYVQMHRDGDTLIAESIPEVSEAYLFMRLHLDDLVATGSWQEETSKTGYYKGAVYNGALQVVLSEDGLKLTGQWVGFGRAMDVKNGKWEFTYVGKELPADATKLPIELPT